MKVKLISYTPNALELLLGTKSARMRGADPATMTEAEKMDHWRYMLDTIKSPFEFVDFIFDIEGVSKNFTHQFVRTRTGAYQQETSRALEIDIISTTVQPEAFQFNGFTEYGEEEGLRREKLSQIWADAMADAQCSYDKLMEAGANLQDARAVCPSNMGTKIQAKFNLRTLSDMAKTRLCARTQGEYQDVYRAMRALVVALYPWTEPLLQVNCVATGQCAFPRWGKEQCKFYRPWMDKTAEQEELRQVFWSTAKQEANPVAHNGKSM